MKNISMTSKQIKINEEPIPITTRSSYSKEEFNQSSYQSEYETVKVQPVWKPSSEYVYKPVTPNLSYTPNQYTSQTPPTSRPKFEPIEKPIQHIKKVTEQKQQKVFKPTPVKNAYSNYVENSSQQSDQTKSYYVQTSGPQTTTYYTAVAGIPVHNTVAQETSNTMHMKESTEKSHRVVNITQTRRVIALDGNTTIKKEEKLEPFPFSPDPQV
jgi:hypothetical protein